MNGITIQCRANLRIMIRIPKFMQSLQKPVLTSLACKFLTSVFKCFYSNVYLDIINSQAKKFIKGTVVSGTRAQIRSFSFDLCPTCDKSISPSCVGKLP